MNFSLPSKWQVVRVLTILVILVVVIPIVLYVIGQFVGFYGGYIVLSNSMVPEFHSGDVVFTHNTAPSTVQVNDTITYYSPGGGTTTHKVVDIVNETNQTLFQTQGVANEEPDPYLVPERAYIGTVVFQIPKLGVLIAFLQTELGMVLFIIIPLSMLIVSEAWALAVAYFEAADESGDGGGDTGSWEEDNIEIDEQIGAALEFDNWADSARQGKREGGDD